MGGFGIRAALDIGRKTLRAQLAGLTVTGNNISNVNTKGYSRQEVTLQSDFPIQTTEGIFGTGVKLEGVKRIRDALIDRQLRNELHSKSKNDILEQVYNQIETTINEPSETGLRKQISTLFDNFQNLANDPENATSRFNLRESAQVLIEGFHRIDKQLRTLSDDIDFDIRRSVETLNSLTKKVSDLNLDIVVAEGPSKGGANELRDERDRAIDQIAEMLDIFALEKPGGIIDISGSEQTLVTSNVPVQLDVNVRNENGNMVSDIVIKGSDEKFTMRDGKLFAQLMARNEIIPEIRRQFDELANELISRVNNIHKTGVGLQGDATDIPKDNDFFSGNSAINIELARPILDNINNIAAAKRVDTLLTNGQVKTTGSPGDNRVALEISELKGLKILNSGTQSLTDFFNSIVSGIGIAGREAHDNVANAGKLITQFTNIREATSSVSLDEEFVNLIKFQRGFEAGARVISTVDDMFQTLINM